MSDELQDALTSATPDPMQELKNDIGLVKDEAKPEPKSEPKPKEEASEPKEEVEVKVEGEEEEESKDEADDVKQEKKESKRNSFEKKLSRQAAANRRQLETINELKAKLAEFEQSKPAEQPAQELKRPDILDFDNESDFNKAMSDYEEQLIEKRFQEREAKEKEQRLQQEQEAKYAEMQSAFEERENRFKARHKNYERNAQAMLDTLEYLPEENLQGSQILRQYVAKSELAPNLIHHLGANPDLIDDITSGDMFEVIKGLYDIERTLKDAPAESKKLPEPIDKMKSSNQGEKSLVDMSWEEMQKRMKL